MGKWAQYREDTQNWIPIPELLAKSFNVDSHSTSRD